MMYMTGVEGNKIKSITGMLKLASDFDVKSVNQPEVFLTCAVNEGECLSDMYMLATNIPEYKSKYSILRQLMQGPPGRGFNGANLLQWGEKISGKEKAVYLTTKGSSLMRLLLSID